MQLIIVVLTNDYCDYCTLEVTARKSQTIFNRRKINITNMLNTSFGELFKNTGNIRKTHTLYIIKKFKA